MIFSAHFYLGYYYKKQGNIDLAIEKYKKVIELCPDYSWAYYNLGSIAFEQNDFDSAIEYLEKTLDFNPKDIDAYKIYSKVLTKVGREDDAVDLLKSAIAQNAHEGDLHYSLAQVFKVQKNLEGYEKALKNALKNYKTLSFHPKIAKKELDDYLAHQN